MWIGLLWIVGCYGMSIVLLHLLLGRRHAPGKHARVLLVTKNNQNQIEWYIRSLFFFSRFKGRQFTATIIDEGSSDETLKIIERLSYTHTVEYELAGSYESVDRFLQLHGEEQVIVVHLGNREELVDIPVPLQ